jgi:hypothetical protein
MAISLTDATLAVGALGTAATGLVDSTKAFSGGMSRVGFGYIKQLIARTVPADPKTQTGAGLTTDDILNTLLANFMNGMDTGAQKAIAKSFIKLHLNPATAAALAAQTNVDPVALVSVATKIAATQPLTPTESDAYGRFDLALSALIDRAYERADQFYRNCCKLLACFFAVFLAWCGNRALGTTLPRWEIIIIGLIATPLAPVAKDIANAIQTASDTIGKLKG